MDDSNSDPDPSRRVPTLVWLLLGLVMIVVFAALVVVLVGHVPHGVVGPPPGSPH